MVRRLRRRLSWISVEINHLPPDDDALHVEFVGRIRWWHPWVWLLVAREALRRG